ncbi:rhamnogalacturonan endolyase family protein, partial [Streptomyces resistomycificus]
MTDLYPRPRTAPRRRRIRRLPGGRVAAVLATAATLAASALTVLPQTAHAATARQVERLDRGLTSVHTSGGNLVSWRWLATDPNDVAFNVYRGGAKLNSSPVTGSTNYFDSGAPDSADYTVRPVVSGTEQAHSERALQFRSGYLDVPISPPAGGRTPDGVSYTYEANDASVGDLDGDGRLDLVLKWYPTNAKDNAQSGYTG